MKLSNIIIFQVILVLIVACGTNAKKHEIVSDEKLTTKDSLTLKLGDLKLISSLRICDSMKYFDENYLLNEFITIEKVDKDEYLYKLKSLVSYLISDTTTIKKVNGVIKLPVLNNETEYVDSSSSVIDETRKSYFYIGQINFLNVFVINGTYWEEVDYKFISKVSGDEIQSFIEFPHISPNKKNIICVYTNPYEREAELTLYTISERNIQFVMAATFKNWMPAAENFEIFWSKENYLYVPVLNSNSFWKKDGSLNDNYQFIKIKIL